MSVTPRSRLIGSTSNERICRSTKPDTLASVSTATAYQARASPGEGGGELSEVDEPVTPES